MRTSSDTPTRRTVPVLHPRKLTALMLVWAFLFSAIALALPAAAEGNILSEQGGKPLTVFMGVFPEECRECEGQKTYNFRE